MMLPGSRNVNVPLAGGETPPRERRGPLDGVAFVTLWTTGPDPTLDGVFRVQILRAGREPGTWERFDRFTNPFAGRGSSRHAPTAGDAGDDAPASESSASARMVREYGVTRAQLESTSSAADVWPEVIAFLGRGPVVAPDAENFEAWHAHLSGSSATAPRTIGLAEIAALFLPGRLALRRGELVALLSRAPAPKHAPEHVRTALIEIVRRVQGLEENVLRVAMMGYTRAWRALSASDERAAARLQLALALLDLPSAWARGDELSMDGLVDGRLAPLGRSDDDVEDVIDSLLPRWTLENERWATLEDVPSDDEKPKPFESPDLATLDAIFEVHLPKSFSASGSGTRDSGPTYRKSQHEVARRVAATLGSGELLLMHAPTGTGKTLAYLVPAMLWARRHGVRVGVATYTRALQEQAMDREVPRALSMLAQAGIATGTRVCVLKGRDNYVCWRALKVMVPEDDSAESWLAWTGLALFSLTDVDGDLDRLPQRPPLPLESSEPYARAVGALIRGVRGQSACCTHREDRDTCAAEVARKRAEKSHVVVINQAFALARQEFFRHVVFDECEHLHEQAHSAWSRTIGFRDIRGLLARLRQPGRSHSRAVLDRLARLLVVGTPSGDSVVKAATAWETMRDAVDELEKEIEGFESWRSVARQARVDREEHSMLREFVLDGDSAGLVAARKQTSLAGHALDTALAELVERIDQMPLRGVGSTRRAVDTARIDLAEVLDAVESWLPLDEGAPSYRPRTFYDVERDARGDTVLAARVLLPHEFLGRNYYPELKSGVFLSATTWLRDGFDAARTYLGLERAAKPLPDEERPPCVVRTFKAPDVFDYRRVMIAIPRDAPSVTDKDKFLDYVRRFVTFVAERTRGRMLVLFTNAQDTKRIGEETAGFFRARRIPLWFQNMEGTVKEELSDLFRATVDSVLLGVDTFWYGADFPGETLEYLVIVRLPYGVPDRYHHAQCAAIGTVQQREQIYVPRALAKFRQGFGRLMRRESDRGCVFVLDGRVLDPRHRFFLRELPIERVFEAGTVRPGDTTGARLVRGDTDHCVHEALAHMNLLADVKRRGLDWSFHSPGRPLRGADESSASTRAHPAGGDGASGADAVDGANASKRHGATLHGGGAQGASVHVSGGDAASSYRAPAESAADSDAMPRTDENTSGDASSTPTARKRREPPPEPFQIQPEDVPF